MDDTQVVVAIIGAIGSLIGVLGSAIAAWKTVASRKIRRDSAELRIKLVEVEARRDSEEGTNRVLLKLIDLFARLDQNIAASTAAIVSLAPDAHDTRLIVEGAVENMEAAVTRSQQDIRELPLKVKEALVSDFQEIPDAVIKAFTPLIQSLEQTIRDMDERWLRRLEDVAKSVPQETKELVIGELAPVKEMVDQIAELRAVVEQLKKILNPNGGEPDVAPVE